jgi:hypothetical protein
MTLVAIVPRMMLPRVAGSRKRQASSGYRGPAWQQVGSTHPAEEGGEEEEEEGEELMRWLPLRNAPKQS